MVKQYGYIDACAQTPDQLTHYVKAISGMQPNMIQGFPFYMSDGLGILVAFGEGTNERQKMNEAVKLALATPGLKNLTVLANHKPEAAPDNAATRNDSYWLLNLPAAPDQKTRNMLSRASRELRVSQETGAKAVTERHMALTAEFCEAKAASLDDASRFIFGKMAAYAESSDNVHVFSAWRHNMLAGYAVADFTSFASVFYMFAFRSRTAPPGTADLILAAILEEAASQGHARINLGLGINEGIEFFKKKWGASKAFAYVETSWDLPAKPGFFAKIAKAFSKKA